MPDYSVRIDTGSSSSDVKNLTDALDKLSKSAIQNEKGVQAVNKENKTLEKTNKTSKDSVESLTRSFDSMKRTITGVVGAYIGFHAIKETISLFAQFEQKMLQAGVIASATGAQFQEMTNLAKELGASTRYTASQAADGLVFLSRAGFTAEESMSALPATLKLATAGVLELGDAADIMTNIMSGFGIAAEDAARVADVLAKTANMSNTDVRQLGEAMKYSAPLAKSLGIQVEEAAAAIGVMGNAGIQASLAGTNLRGVMARLLEPTQDGARAIQEMGLTLEQVNPQINDLQTIFGLLSQNMMSPNQALEIFGRLNVSAALALKDNVSQLEEFIEKNENAAGTVDKVAEAIDSGMQGALYKLASAFEALRIAIVDGFLKDALQGSINLMADFLRYLSESPKLVALLTTAMLGLGAAITGLGLVTAVGLLNQYRLLLASSTAMMIEFALKTTLGAKAVGMLNIALAATGKALGWLLTGVKALIATPFGLVLTGISLAVGGVIAATEYMISSNKELLASIGANNKGFGEAIAKSKTLADNLRLLSNFDELKGHQFFTLNNELASTKLAIKSMIKELKEQGNEFVKFGEKSEMSEKSLRTGLTVVQALASHFGSTQKAIQKAGESLGDTQGSIDEWILSAGKGEYSTRLWQEALKIMAKELDENTVKIKDSAHAVLLFDNNIKQLKKDIGKPIESPFEDLSSSDSFDKLTNNYQKAIATLDGIKGSSVFSQSLLSKEQQAEFESVMEQVKQVYKETAQSLEKSSIESIDKIVSANGSRSEKLIDQKNKELAAFLEAENLMKLNVDQLSEEALLEKLNKFQMEKQAYIDTMDAKIQATEDSENFIVRLSEKGVQDRLKQLLVVGQTEEQKIAERLQGNINFVNSIVGLNSFLKDAIISDLKSVTQAELDELQIREGARQVARDTEMGKLLEYDEAERARIEEKYTNLKIAILDMNEVQNELDQDQLDKKLAIIDEEKQAELAKVKDKIGYNKYLSDTTKKQLEIDRQNELKSQAQRLQATGSFFGAMSALIEASGSKNLGVLKAFKSAEIVANTASAIMNQMGGGDPYTAFARAAAAGAMGAAQLINLWKAEPGAGGGGISSGGASVPSYSSASSSDQPTTPQSSQGPSSTLEQSGRTITIEVTNATGSEIDETSARRIADALGDYVTNGGQIQGVTA